MLGRKHLLLWLSLLGLLIGGASAPAQTPEELMAIRGEYAAALDAHDIDKMLTYWVDDCIYDYVQAPPIGVGKADIRTGFEELFWAYPDLVTDEGRVFAVDNIVVVEHNTISTFMDTGIVVISPHLDIYEFEGDKIKKATTYGDAASEMVQIGVMEAPVLPPLVPTVEVPEAEATGLSPVEAIVEGFNRWNTGDLSHYATMVHADAEFVLPGIGALDKSANTAMHELYLQAFPDRAAEIVRTLDLGDGWAAAEVVYRGTHQGEYFGIPGTGRPFNLRGVALQHIDADGLITYLAAYFDNLTLITQITTPTTEELLGVRAGFAAALDAQDVDRLVSYWTDDAVFDLVPFPEPLRGKEEIGGFFATQFAASPDYHTDQGRVLAADNMVVVEHSVLGTNTGDWEGIGPATGNPWQHPHVDIYEFEGDKIKKLTTYADMTVLLLQLGFLEPPEMPELVPSFVLPDAEPTGLAPLEAAGEGIARWNSHDLEHYAKMLHPDLRVFAGPLGMELDRDAWVAVSELYYQIFTGARIDIVREVDLGNGWVLVEEISSSVQNGPFLGVPPSGRDVAVRAVLLSHFDADGLMTYMGYYFDNLTIVNQITGVTPVDPGSDGLVAYYPLDADASDASGNGLDGALMGDPQAIIGAIGGAMEFDGEGDVIEVASDASLDITGPISLSLWIRPDAEDPEGQGTETAPMCKALSTANPSWSWQVRYGWNSPQPYMAFTFNTSPRAWAYVGQNLQQGEWHHIACSADGETLTAYLNGQATESTPMGAIASSPAPILIGSDGWGSDWIGGIDEVRIYSRALSAGEMLFLTGYMADVTAPGDLVQGVPDDGDWPAAETPDLAIDDNVNTKYLHFKGDFNPDAGPTGFRVKPGVGPTVVTGVSFTTANDVPGRDPIAFELYGSNASIDGPYTLVASRDIVDFAGATEWPRFTKNATPIVLTNDTAYTYYQVLFTAIRGPVGGSVNSMQIAEVELLGKPAVPTPDVEANKEVARRFFEEMWNNRDMDLVEELISPDMKGHAPTGDFIGYEGERQTVLGTVAAFPDLVITIDEMIAEDNKVALLTSYHGTHTGPLMGQIPPTGAEVTMTGGILFHFEAGKIVEAWSFADMLGLMQQIGAASPARPASEDYAWLPSSELTGDPGDLEVNKTMITRFVEEVWNQKDLGPIVELFHPDSFGNNPPVNFMYAPYMSVSRDEGFTQSVSDYMTALPDMHVTIHEIVAEGDRAMAYWTVNGTHLGELAGIPATGNPVTFSGHTMYRFADGQIVESWWAWDTLGLMQQITPAKSQ